MTEAATLTLLLCLRAASARSVPSFSSQPKLLGSRRFRPCGDVMSGGDARAFPAPGEPFAGWRFLPSGAPAFLTLHTTEVMLPFSSAHAQHFCSLRLNHAGGMWGDAPASASLVPQRHLVWRDYAPELSPGCVLRVSTSGLSHRGQAYAWSWTSQSRVPFCLDDSLPGRNQLGVSLASRRVLRAPVCDHPSRS